MYESAQGMLLKARELEAEIQSVAFSLLRDEGKYDEAQQLLVVASDVRRLEGRLDEIVSGRPKRAAAEEKPRSTSARSRKGASSKYPIFYVAGGRLVKIGRGKQKTAKEYRHESPRSAFDVVARWIESAGMSGSQEWFARAADEELSGQVPTYQVYLVIAALQHAGVVRPVRRGWYSLAQDVGGPEDWWNRLVELGSEEPAGSED